MSNRFQFRWGIPEWDTGFTEIPNPILQYYSALGLTNTEAMFIIHLASFHFESAKGECRPSLTGTLKERMGYKSNQGIVNIMKGLEKKKLVSVERRPGKPSVYDFTAFSQAVMKLWKADQSIKPDQSTKVDTPPVNKSRRHQSTKLDSKKEKKKENPQEEKSSSARSADKKPDTRLPDTDFSRTMFGRLQANARAVGHKGPSLFRSLEQKRKFDEAADRLGEAEFERALQKGLEQGINAVNRMTNWIAKWNGDYSKKSQSNPRHDPGKFDRARAMTLERLSRVNQ